MSEQIIIEGDCLEVMRGFADKQFDLVLTDPPYGIDLDTDFSGMVSRPGGYKGKMRGNTYEKVENDVNFNFQPYFEEIKRISKRQVIFGADYILERSEFIKGSISIWDKRLTDSADLMFGSCFETVWFFPRRKRDFYRYKWAGIFGTEREREKVRLHPTQKPLELVQQIMSEVAKEGESVLDPFMGSGTTIVAAQYLKLNATGIEISPKYCEIARNRLAQQQLF